MVDEQVEREDKYDVGPGFVLPELTLRGDSLSAVTTTHQLEAVYYDTAGRDLMRHRLTLRRRTGGMDAGWHLKVPGRDGRTEIRVESRAAGLPRELSQLLRGVARGQRLTPAARLTTERVSTVLTDAAGSVLADVALDHVHSATMGDHATLDEWHELEVELGPAGDTELLRRLGAVVSGAGAVPSASASKAARALGPLTQPPDRRRLSGLVDDYLRAQVEAIVAGDLGLRRELDVIHPTRVAVRRLRSTLRTMHELFEPGAASVLEVELRWYAGVLGAVRDLDILRPRLMKRLSALPPELRVGPVEATLVSKLAADRGVAWRTLLRTLNGRRYRALLNLLEQWRVDPPYTAVGDDPRKSAVGYVDGAERLLRKRLRKAADPEAADDLVHGARKAGKRFRYAVELAEPVLGNSAAETIQFAKNLQDQLGDYQDSVVSAEVLHRLGATSGAAKGHNGFTYGVLMAQEQARARQIRDEITATFG